MFNTNGNEALKFGPHKSQCFSRVHRPRTSPHPPCFTTMPSRLTTAALALAAAAAVVPLSAAQAINQTYVTGLISGLNALNLTSTTAVLQTVAGTPAGQSLLAKLSSGTPYTVLIPDNDVSSPCCS